MRIVEILLPKGTSDRSLSPQTIRKIDALQQRMDQYVDKIMNPGTSSAGKEFLKSKLRDDYYELKGLIKPVHKVAEASMDWHGTHSGTAQAGITDHDISEAEEYVKKNYPYSKTYSVRRAEYGFRTLKKHPQHFLDLDPMKTSKSDIHMSGVDGAITQLGLEQNPMMSGSYQHSPSIGYSWNTLENKSTNIVVLYYQDRGMGNDQITVAAKDKKNLLGAISIFQDAGVIQSPEERKERRQDKADTRNQQASKKGIKTGAIINTGHESYEIVGFTPGGKVKVKNSATGNIATVSPASIKSEWVNEPGQPAKPIKQSYAVFDRDNGGQMSKTFKTEKEAQAQADRWEEVSKDGRNIVRPVIKKLAEAVHKLPLSHDDFEVVIEVMKKPIPAIIAPIYISEIIEDDELNDQIKSIEDTDPNRDIRPLIAEWFNRVMPDQMYRFTGDVQDYAQKNGVLSPIHGYDSHMYKGTNDPLTGDAYGSY